MGEEAVVIGAGHGSRHLSDDVNRGVRELGGDSGQQREVLFRSRPAAGLPIPSLGLALGFLPISLTHSWTVGAVVESTVVLRMAELREFLVAIAFLMLALECWTWASRSSQARRSAEHTRYDVSP